MDAVTAKAWMGLISQRSRLLQIDTPLPDALQVERLSGREAVCEGFRFEVDCISASAFLDLRELLGREVGLRLARPSGPPVHWHGLVTQARRTGADGGLARYRLVLEPWLALLAHRRNALVFQDCDARAVLERVFADYPQANVRFDLSLPLPTRPIRTQFRETDLDFVRRVMAEDGLSWYIEHTAGETHGEQARHRLVVVDAQAQCGDADPAAIRFHRADATEASDAITLFSRQLAVVPDSATVASWACDRLAAPSATEGRGAGESAGWDVFDGAGARRFEGDDDAARCARARLGALQLPGELYAGEGSARGLAAGVGFTLLQHQGLGGKRYRPLVVEHEAANNLGAQIAALFQATDVERGTYRNRFVCAPAELVPLPLPRARPAAPGPQTARVVGHADQTITSQRDHQVRIQFPWQRGKAPVAGGLDDAASSATPEGHAPGDQRSGTWVRVAEAVAGPNWGTHFLPRIGSEVLVEFDHGDIDRPVIVGQLYNGDIAPPFAAGEGSSANHTGVLSGIRTEGLDGDNPQQWVVDDTDGQLRQRLETTLTDARLELGHLIDQSGTRRGAFRGSGFELKSLGWGRMHAAGGLLVSTTAREGARSVQMDTRDALGQLRAAGSTSANVVDAATARGVPATAANGAIDTLLDHLDPEAGAAYDGPVSGQPSGKPAPGTRDPDTPTERFAQPQLVLEAPSDVVLTSLGTMALTAGEHLNLTCQDDLHLAAAHTIALASGESAGLSAHARPLRLVAANGPVSLHAHTDALELLADDSVMINSTDDSVEVLAKQRIELRVGSSAITLEGGNVTLACSGRFTAKGAVHPFAGAASGSPELVALPDGRTAPFRQTRVEGPSPDPAGVARLADDAEATSNAPLGPEAEHPQNTRVQADSGARDCAEEWRVDASFLETSEGALVLRGYVPTRRGEVIGQSGVTISTGVDLGQQNRSGTSRVLKQFVDERGGAGEVSIESLLATLDPYFTLKRQDSVAKLAENPLSVSMPQAELLADAFKYDFQLTIDRQFNRRNNLGMKFRSLPTEAQTVILDFAYQYGPSDRVGPIRQTFWGHVYEGQWQVLADWLKGAPDAYRSRRMREGELLQSAIDQSKLPEVGDPCPGNS